MTEMSNHLCNIIISHKVMEELFLNYFGEEKFPNDPEVDPRSYTHEHTHEQNDIHTLNNTHTNKMTYRR